MRVKQKSEFDRIRDDVLTAMRMLAGLQLRRLNLTLPEWPEGRMQDVLDLAESVLGTAREVEVKSVRETLVRWAKLAGFVRVHSVNSMFWSWGAVPGFEMGMMPPAETLQLMVDSLWMTKLEFEVQVMPRDGVTVQGLNVLDDVIARLNEQVAEVAAREGRREVQR